MVFKLIKHFQNSFPNVFGSENKFIKIFPHSIRVHFVRGHLHLRAAGGHLQDVRLRQQPGLQRRPERPQLPLQQLPPLSRRAGAWRGARDHAPGHVVDEVHAQPGGTAGGRRPGAEEEVPEAEVFHSAEVRHVVLPGAAVRPVQLRLPLLRHHGNQEAAPRQLHRRLNIFLSFVCEFAWSCLEFGLRFNFNFMKV